jgi:hypothetical protein
MLTVSDFVRWLREQVIQEPAVAGYEICMLFDLDNVREETEEWFVDHNMHQVVIVGKSDELTNDADYPTEFLDDN